MGVDACLHQEQCAHPGGQYPQGRGLHGFPEGPGRFFRRLGCRVSLCGVCVFRQGFRFRVAIGPEPQVFRLLDNQESHRNQGNNPHQRPQHNPRCRPAVAEDHRRGYQGEGHQPDGMGREENAVGTAPHSHEPPRHHHRRSDGYGTGEDDPADSVEQVEEYGYGGPGQGYGGEAHDENAGGQHQPGPVPVYQPAHQRGEGRGGQAADAGRAGHQGAAPAKLGVGGQRVDEHGQG